MLITQTPLRVSFFGGGTDFLDFYRQEEGCVLSTAIDKFIFVVVKRRFDDKIRVGYTRTEMVDSVDEVRHDLVREALKMTGVERQVEIGTLGDIPAQGSGLGSSSAVTVGVLNALSKHQGGSMDAEKLAQAACEIEIDRLRKPIGKQDQYIAAYGGLRFIRFLPDDTVVVERVEMTTEEMRRLARNLLLFFTNRTRRSETVLAEQRTNINRRLDALRELKSLARQARELLQQGDFEAFGRMLHQGWELKKGLASKISNAYIDDLYDTARKAGALGGKITGAGGGGFLLLYCPPETQERVRERMGSLRELPFRLEPDGSKVIFDYRRT